MTAAVEALAGTPPANTAQALRDLLDKLGEHPEAVAEITGEIEATFGEQRAVAVIDMSGFTRTTRARGIVAFLLMIHQVRRLAVPVVQGHRGVVVKTEADNLWCLFDTVPDAVAASRDIIARLDSANVVLPSDRELYVSIGIGYGHLLNVGDEDVYGDEVNLAGKLGEDLAGQGEVLLTPAAAAELAGQDVALEEQAVSISGIELTYFAVGLGSAGAPAAR